MPNRRTLDEFSYNFVIYIKNIVGNNIMPPAQACLKGYFSSVNIIMKSTNVIADVN